MTGKKTISAYRTKRTMKRTWAALILDLDLVLHELMRLRIMSILAMHQSATFLELKHMLRSSDGNLSVHARKLEQAGYLVCSKCFEGRIPRTEYRISPVGRSALESYLRQMNSLSKALRKRPR